LIGFERRKCLLNWNNTSADVDLVQSSGKALSVQSSYAFTAGSAVFDEPSAGLVPVLELAEQTGLSRLIGEHVDHTAHRGSRGKGGRRPSRSDEKHSSGELTSILAGLRACAPACLARLVLPSTAIRDGWQPAAEEGSHSMECRTFGPAR
jgi:hypothetical protein